MQFLIFPVRNPEKYLRRSSLFSKKRETEKKDATFFFYSIIYTTFKRKKFTITR